MSEQAEATPEPRVEVQGGFEVRLDDDPLPYFPRDEFRPRQRGAILAIDKAFRDGYKYVVVQAPTGAGKSMLGVTLGGKFPCFYVTSQKILQDQYSTDFPDRVALVKGRGEYTCGVTGKPSDVAPCVRKKKRAKLDCKLDEKGNMQPFMLTHCEYVAAMQRALTSRIALFNYHSFHYMAKRFGKRPMVIADECHNIESIYMGIVELVLKDGMVKGLLLDKNLSFADTVDRFDPRPDSSQIGGRKVIDIEPAEQVPWDAGQEAPAERGEFEGEDEAGGDEPGSAQVGTPARGAYYEVIRLAYRQAKLDIEMTRDAERDRAMREADRLERLLGKLADLWKTHQEGKLEENWVLGWETAKLGGVQTMRLKPVFVAEYVRQYFLSRADRFLFLSATVLDVHTFAKSIGVDAKEVYYITMGSNFPVENRRVHLYPAADMSWKAQGRDNDRLETTLRSILRKHAGQRGIIHTHTGKLVDFIQERLGAEFGRRLICQSGKVKREDLLLQHAESRDGILVAPAMHEGLDLKGDLSRFQILLKVPWPDMKDPQIAARMKVDPDWYSWLALLKFVQSCGRSVRSETDYAETYVLDTGAKNFCRRTQGNMPKWFLEGLVEHTVADVNALIGGR